LEERRRGVKMPVGKERTGSATHLVAHILFTIDAMNCGLMAISLSIIIATDFTILGSTPRSTLHGSIGS